MRHPRAAAPAVLVPLLGISAAAAIIGVQLLTKLGVTPNTSLVGEQLRRPVRPPVPQIEEHLPVRGQVQPVCRDERPQRIAAQPLEPRSIPRRHDDDGVEIEAVPPGMTGAAPRRRQRQQLR